MVAGCEKSYEPAAYRAAPRVDVGSTSDSGSAAKANLPDITDWTSPDAIRAGGNRYAGNRAYSGLRSYRGIRSYRGDRAYRGNMRGYAGLKGNYRGYRGAQPSTTYRGYGNSRSYRGNR